MSSRSRCFLLLLLLGVFPRASAAERVRVPLDECIGKGCKFGKYVEITVTEKQFILTIDPNRCREMVYYCPTSYKAFQFEDGTPARVEGYELGKKSTDRFTVYIPRKYDTLFIIAPRKSDRDPVFDLRPFDKYLPAAGVAAAETVPAEAVPEADEVDTPSATGNRNAHGVGIVFGVESYSYAPPARHAANDATAFGESLRKRFGFSEDRVLVRTDARATKGEFERAFSANGWLARQVSAKSDVVVYFSGLGARNPGSGQGFLMLHDTDPEYPFTGYPLEELSRNLAALGVRSITIVLDASFSGRTRDNRPILPDAEVTGLERDLAAVPSATLLFLAASESETNAASEDRPHGLFTYWFLKGLGEEADLDHDGRVTAAEIETFVRDRVAADAARAGDAQHPVLVGQDTDRVLLTY